MEHHARVELAPSALKLTEKLPSISLSHYALGISCNSPRNFLPRDPPLQSSGGMDSRFLGLLHCTTENHHFRILPKLNSKKSEDWDCLMHLHLLLSHEAGGSHTAQSMPEDWVGFFLLYCAWLPNWYPQQATNLPGMAHPRTAALPPIQQSAPRLPGGRCPYQDVRVLGCLPWGWAGAVAEFEYPVVLGSDKEVPWQEAAYAQAEEDDVGSVEAVLRPWQAGWGAVQQLLKQCLLVGTQRAACGSVDGV